MHTIISCEYLISPATCDTNDIESQIEDLALLSENLTDFLYAPVIEKDALATLLSLGFYPCERLFNKNISKLEDCYFSGNDVARLVNRILQRARCFTEIEQVLAEPVEISSNIETKNSERNEELNNLIFKIIIQNIYSGEGYHLLHFNKDGDANIINFKFVSDEIYTNQDIIKERIDLDQDFIFFNEYKALLSNLDGAKLYQHSLNESDIKLSFYVGALNNIKERNSEISRLKKFSFGEDFLETLSEHGCAPNQQFSPVFFDVIRCVISNNPKNEIKPFTVSSASNKQRAKGSFLANRTHITKGNPALRLMFWENENNEIIFSNVANKKDLTIL